MHVLRVPFFRCLLLLLVAVLLPVSVWSQESDNEMKDKSSILLRVLCARAISGAAELGILQKEKIPHELKLASPSVSDPLPVERGKLFLVRANGGDRQKDSDSLLEVTIPAAGKRFVLALFPSPNPASGEPYRHRLIRIDGQRFGVSDLYLFNLTTVSIAGKMGKAPFALASNKSSVVTPEPDRLGERMYQTRFYFRNKGKTRLFNDTRWPLAKASRVYVFFVPDPARKSIGYHAFREYLPFP